MKVKSRKQARKELRKAKKVQKHEFFCKKILKNKKLKENKKKFVGKGRTDSLPKMEKLKSVKSENKSFNEKEENVGIKTDVNKAWNKKKTKNLKKRKRNFKSLQEKIEYEREKEKKEKEIFEREIREERIKQLKKDNLKEDLEIKKLQKQLKMSKGKSRAFAADGLDYLLDVCDKKLSEGEFEKTFEDSDLEFENDIDNIFGSPKIDEDESVKTHKKKKKDEEEEENVEKLNYESNEREQYTDDDDFDDEEEKLDLESSCSSENDDGVSMGKLERNSKRKLSEDHKKMKRSKVKFEDSWSEESVEEGIPKEDVKKTGEVSQMWEDIYGRTRDEKGNIVKTYVPPQIRKNAGEINIEKGREKLDRLRKQLKGLLNRLAESNMAFISNQIEQLYMSNSRNDMNETLWSLFNDSLFCEVLTPERLITEHAMLIAVLHSNIGSEIGAHFLQHSVTQFNNLLQSNPPVEDKRINNVLLFIMHMYNFQIFHSKLMYNIVDELLKNLNEKQIELLLLTLRTVGFNLRKDDPVALKSLVIRVQEKANSSSAQDNSSRVKFMLEMLMAIKNNNMSKIPNYNPEFVEKLRKTLKLFVRKGNFSTELNIALQDLLNAEKHGRWWIVGSAWSGSTSIQSHSDESRQTEVKTNGNEFSKKLLELAKQQRMNTDVRRNIFCILMSAEDFLEAFEKVIKLKLKGAVEREIMNVLLHCALQEKNFNPYYVYLANKFCMFDRKYQMMLQCAIWDKMKELKNSLPVQVTNFAKFVGHVILEKGLPVSILKVVEFSELDKATIKFMRQVLLTILLKKDRSAVAAVFRRIADSNKLKLFRESLRLFLQHFVVKNTKSIEQEKVSKIVEMVKVAEQALESSDVHITF